MRPEVFIQRLEELQATFTKQSLASPAARDLFEYGRVVGVVAGLEMAKSTVFEMLGEERKRERELDR